MAGRGTGKYFAPVYRAKKSPVKVRRIRLFKRCGFIALAVAVAACAIAAFQINRNAGDSFVRVAASEQSLAEVSSYPRIVSHSSPLPEDYVPDNLMSLGTLPNGENVWLRADAAEAFLEMCAAMSKDGLGIVPVRGYTSYEDQSGVLADAADRLVAEGAKADEARKIAAADVFAPGEDEAQLGTSVDVSIDVNCVDKFTLTEQYQWICQNAYRYGFIIRYTADKKNITCVSAKPWHLRYVGREAAEFMVSCNMCLEEYVAAVKADNLKAVEQDQADKAEAEQDQADKAESAQDQADKAKDAGHN